MVDDVTDDVNRPTWQARGLWVFFFLVDWFMGLEWKNSWGLGLVWSANYLHGWG